MGKNHFPNDESLFFVNFLSYSEFNFERYKLLIINMKKEVILLLFKLGNEFIS